MLRREFGKASLGAMASSPFFISAMIWKISSTELPPGLPIQRTIPEFLRGLPCPRN